MTALAPTQSRGTQSPGGAAAHVGIHRAMSAGAAFLLFGHPAGSGRGFAPNPTGGIAREWRRVACTGLLSTPGGARVDGNSHSAIAANGRGVGRRHDAGRRVAVSAAKKIWRPRPVPVPKP
jgi:hypothetical protein